VSPTTVDIAIPILNEERGLGRCIATLTDVLTRVEKEHDLQCTVTIVDNGSTDGSWVEAGRLATSHPSVRALKVARPGRGGALKRAWLSSDADVLAYMDVDLSTDLDALPPLLNAVAGGSADLATGSRLAPGAKVERSVHRELISRVYNIIARSALGYSISDSQCGFKAISRAAAQELVPQVVDDSWFFDTELLTLAWRAGMRIHEVPVSWVEDDDSRVKLASTAADDLNGIWRLMRTADRRPVGATERPGATATFDRHASDYADSVDRSVAFTGKDSAFYAERKIQLLGELAVLHGRPLVDAAVLDVGCGTGTTDRFLRDEVRSLRGVDVSEEMVAIARAEVPGVEFSAYDGTTLPFADETFDVVVAVCVLHHVARPERPHFVAELVRVLAPGGLLAIFEHNPFNPLTRRAVSTCPLDRGVVLLSAGDVESLIDRTGAALLERRFYLFTPLSGRSGPTVDRLFRRIPLGGQHVVVATRHGR